MVSGLRLASLSAARSAKRSYPSAMSNMIRFASGSFMISAMVRASSARLHQCSASSRSVVRIYAPPVENDLILHIALSIKIASPAKGFHTLQIPAVVIDEQSDQPLATDPVVLVEARRERTVEVEHARNRAGLDKR